MEDIKKISSEIEAERELLEDIVGGVQTFVNKYQDIKAEISKLKGLEDFNIKEATETINSSLDKTNIAISEYCEQVKNAQTTSKEIDAQVDKLKENLSKTNDVIESLNYKLSGFLDNQSKAMSSIAKLDEYMSNLKSVDYNQLEKKINDYSKKIDQLEFLINKDVKNKVEENSKQISTINSNIENLLEKLNDSDISTLLQEIKTINTLISETQKEKFALSQELDVELNAWADRNGIKRKKK